MVDTLVRRLHAPDRVALPGPHLGLTWRPVARGDLDQIRHLTQVTEEANKVVRRTPDYQLNQFVDESVEGRYADAIIGVDGAGEVQAFGLAYLYREDTEVARAELFAATMPKWRGRGIGRALLTWQDARARQLLLAHWGADSTMPARISNVVEAHQRDRRQLYAAAGYAPTSLLGVYRHDLREVPRVQAGAGIEVRNLRPGDRERVHRLHQVQVLANGNTLAQAERWWNRIDASLDEDLSFVAIGEGRLLAYTLVCHHSRSWLAGVDADASIEARGPLDDENVRLLLSHTLQWCQDANFTGISTEASLAHVGDTAPILEEMGFNKIGLRMVYTVDL